MIARFLTFLTVFVILSLLEKKKPFRPEQASHIRVNFLMIVFSWILSFPASTFLVQSGFIGAATPGDSEVKDWFYGFVILDFVVFLQHYLTHKIPALWRLHKIHHSETIMTSSAGVRFHPLEIFLSLLYKLSVVYLFNIHLHIYIAFEITLNLASLFSHANIYIPPTMERLLRLFWLTPSLHRIHHSLNRHEENSNFGLSSCFWDKLFGTYLAYDVKRVEKIEVGIEGVPHLNANRASFLLKWPFVKDSNT